MFQQTYMNVLIIKVIKKINTRKKIKTTGNNYFKTLNPFQKYTLKTDK